MAEKLYKFHRNKKKNEYLNIFSRCGSITKATAASGISRQTHYFWMQDPSYAIAFGKAKEISNGLLEDEAMRRAVDGFDEVITNKDGEQTIKHRYSDRLLEILLKANMPDKYCERVEETRKGDGASVLCWEGEEGDQP